MSVLDNPLRVSINRAMINKNEANDKSLFVDGWENVAVSSETLASHINNGIAYCAQLSGPRKAANFLETNFLSVDIDGTRRIDDVMRDTIVQNYLTIFCTTPSHTDAEHRLRLGFALPRFICTAVDAVAANRSLALHLSGDRAATDATRIFYGSRGSRPLVFDRRINEQFLADLIAQGKDTDQRDSVGSDSSHATTASAKEVHLDHVVVTEGGAERPFKLLSAGTRVFCPFHYDRSPSAFVTVSKRGVTGLHCSTCAQTFWPPGTDPAKFDFYDFDKQVIAAHNYFVKNEDMGPFQPILDDAGKSAHPGLMRSRIYLTQSEFVSAIPEKEGLFFYKSPKGTGKTEMLRGLLQSTGQTAILIGDRVALIRQSCNRLGLDFYANFLGPLRSARLGICLDSLGRLVWQQRLTSYQTVTKRKLYNTIIIDEAEQLLSHFLSDTMKSETRDYNFMVFRTLLKNAKRIIALDADLSWTSFETLTKLSQPDEGSRQTFVILNDHKTEKQLQLFHSDQHLIGDLKQSLADGKRIFVTSNSKARIDKIAAAVEKTFDGKISAIKITSDTTQSEVVKSFIHDVSTRSLVYQLILTSPSLGTGVDITFDNRETHIDEVYGFFEPLITTHFDMDQQLARVRHPGMVKVYVSPRRYRFDTGVDVVKHDIQRNNLYKNTLKGFDDDLRPQYHTDDPFIDMAALIVSNQRASKNNQKRHFVEMKRQQGFDVQLVEKDSGLADEGRELDSIGKALAKAQRTALLMEARTLTRAEFEDIEERMGSNSDVSTGERWCLQRTRIELFYRQLLSPDLIDLDGNGKHRLRIRRFESLQSYAERASAGSSGSLPFLKAKEMTKARFVKDERIVGELFYNLLQRTPVYDGQSFCVDSVFGGHELGVFQVEMAKQKSHIETTLEVAVGSMEPKHAIPQLNAILKRIGLHCSPVRTSRAKSLADGKKIYLYRLDSESLEAIEALIQLREETRGWDVVYDAHGWADEND